MKTFYTVKTIQTQKHFRSFQNAVIWVTERGYQFVPSGQDPNALLTLQCPVDNELAHITETKLEDER